MRNAAQAVAPILSEDLKAFAQTIRQDRVPGAPIDEGMLEIILTAFEMFAVAAKALEDEKLLLESRLSAADCRIEALTVPDYLGAHLRDAAIREGERAGNVIDLRDIFLGEHDFNAERRQQTTNDGDAA